MSAATAQPGGSHQPHKGQIGEWFWRFLAVVMLVLVCWVVWIAVQISPSEMVLPAAYEAAAKGRASRNSGGAIAPAVDPAPAQAANGNAESAPPVAVTAVATTAESVVLPTAPSLPPVNLDKLRMAESIETPIFERTRRPARPAAEAQ